jgi:hypothetical protein
MCQEALEFGFRGCGGDAELMTNDFATTNLETDEHRQVPLRALDGRTEIPCRALWLNLTSCHNGKNA